MGKNEKSNSILNEVYRDYITQGYNRRGFINVVESMRENGIQLKEYCILFINIKGFKAINEIFDVEGGDKLLVDIFCNVMKSFLLPDVGARKESDHFVFLVKRQNLDMERLSELLKVKWEYHNREMLIHCMCGIYLIDKPGKAVEGMIDRAKLAKDFIVDEYIKPYAIYENYMRESYMEKMKLLSSFENSLENNEFQVHYQPVVDAMTGKMVSAEALVRWHRNNGQIISPNVFIPILEKYGYITKLDEYIVKQVAAYMHKRKNAGKVIIPTSVNLSRMDFVDETSTERLILGIKNSTLPEGSIRFEITETSDMNLERYYEAFIKSIHECKGLIYLDDFGTGYSTFAMLKDHRFDILKIDMSLIRKLEENSNVKIIVRTIINMCHDMNIKVVAEGVDTEGQLKILQKYGCDYIQGYLFSKPLDEKEFERYTDNNGNWEYTGDCYENNNVMKIK